MVEPPSISSPQTSPQAVTPENPQVTPPPAAATGVSAPQNVSSVVSEGSDLSARSDPATVEYAGLGARFLATMVDGMIVGAIYLVLRIPVFILGIVTAARGGRPAEVGIFSVLGFLVQLIGLAESVGYYIYFTAKGQTLGKKALKIRVVRVENGEAPGYLKAFLREVVGKMVSGAVLGLGYLWPLWDSRKQAWHDKIAGTVVVKA